MPGQPEKMLEVTLALINESLAYFDLNHYMANAPMHNTSMSLITSLGEGVDTNSNTDWRTNVKAQSIYFKELCYDTTPLTELEINLVRVSADSTITADNSDWQTIKLHNHMNYVLLAGSVQSKLVDGVMEKIPRNFKEATSPEFSARYKLAIQTEIDYKLKYDVYDTPVYELPVNMKPLGYSWQFVIKTHPDGSLNKYTARLCTQGFDQEYMLNYWETYSPTVMKESLRIMFFLVTSCGFTEWKFDVTKAFLNAPVDGEVWVVLPNGMPGFDPDRKQYCRLKKGDYGTKQAMACFAEFTRGVLLKEGYVPCVCDPCLYMKNVPPLLSYISVHVDDFPCVSNDPLEPQRLEISMNKYWITTSSPTTTKLLGIRVHRNPDQSLIVFNDVYFTELAMSIGLELKPLHLLGNPKERFTANTLARASIDMHKVFRRIVGSVLWSSLNWRMDLDYKSIQLGRFVNNPSLEHIDAAVDVLRYAWTTRLKGLCYKKTDTPMPSPLKIEFLGWTDSDWDKDCDSVSVSGHCISMHFPVDVDKILELPVEERCASWPKNNIISYSSRKQSTFIATSSEAAESRAICDVAKPLKFLKDLAVEKTLMDDNDRPTYLLCDNSATIVNMHQGKVHQKNRHHARELAFARSMVVGGYINPYKVATAHNHADIFTKMLPKHVHDYHVDWYMADAILDVPRSTQRQPKKARMV